ncbi:MAG TPA: tryptophan synthase subunit alpha [Thermodesulfobacteriota bacterium]|nr:tryptophan synthase subunit alpha [Thermodesulfobacteriota bacterium]
MERIEKRFSELRKKGEKALVVYLTAGYPDLATSRDLILALDAAGADVLELGVPFSDPTADGPSIQRASQKALQNGTSLPRILGLVENLRPSTEMPVVLFSYYNPILAYGNDRFARQAGDAGADGVLVVDLPAEEAGELKKHTDPAGLNFISLVAPTTDAGRMRQIVKGASGFIYYISLTGVTGTGRPQVQEIRQNVSRIKKVTQVPVVAGFGVSTPAQAREIGAETDGIVVGSAFIRLVEEKAEKAGLQKAAYAFARRFKKALR